MVMIDRRLKIIVISVLALSLGMCLSVSYAAPPQFNPQWEPHYTVFSPFPGFEKRFISSITPTEYVPLINLQRGRPYEFEYDYPDYSLTYARRIKEEMTMVPVTSPLDKFVDRRIQLSMRELSSDIGKRSLVKAQKDKAGGIISFQIPIKSRAFESIFGEGGAGLRVNGYRKISFTGRSTWTDQQETAFNKQSKFPVLQMEQIYRFDIEGNIGSKISVKVSQDSRNDMPLANRLILRYNGGEDDILQTVEAGNTTLDLPATQFLRYSTRVQGLFGIKATAQLADLSITAIASQEKGSTETIEISAGGSSMATRVIRDVDYKKRTIYDLGRLPLNRAQSDDLAEPDKYDFLPGDKIITAILYHDDLTSDPIRFSRTDAICYVDPEDTLSDDPRNQYRTEGFFEKVDEVDYFINPTEFYVLFLSSIVGYDDVIGVYMEVERPIYEIDTLPGGVIDTTLAGTVVDTIGDISSEPLKLKLIKPREYTEPNHHVWEYEWKNVYWLGGSNLDLTQLDVTIYKGSMLNNQTANPDDPDNQNGVNYLRILGLDQGDNNGDGSYDNELDRKVHVDPVLGYLYFPSRHPFDSRLTFTTNPATGEPVSLRDSVPEIYNSTSTTVQQSSKYYIAVKTHERGSSVINLNATNIIEGSEVITSRGQRLNRGKDYEIDYDFGRLTLLSDTLDINSDINVMFETAPFFSLAKKTLLGTRLQYSPHRDFKVGATLLYKSDKSTNRKPKVGEETSKIFVWDADFNYRLENPLMTKFANAIPFVSASAQSYMQLSAEVAQSRPNPNVDGQVFIDDFEGAKDSYSLGIMRTNWRKASRPVAVDTLDSERGHVAWYNPFDPIPVDQIWPNRDVGTGESGNTNILKIVFKPVDHKYVQTYNEDSVQIIDSTSVPINREKSWAGFMRNIPTGVATQLETAQLLEMRMRGDKGIMHIDLGRISEDINGNGLLNNEDEDGYRILEPEEDVGLDGLADPQEWGYDPDNGVTDPAGDNYEYNDPYNFDIWRINGTEGNREDPDGGNYPDTEDPDFDGLETVDSYFSYRIDLSDTLDYYNGFYVEDTRNDDDWRTIRIPLRDPQAMDTVVNDPAWTNIWFVRIWFDSLPEESMDTTISIDIASLEMLSTTWADSFVVADSQRSGTVSFDVAVVNDEVNKDYVSPPGVEGYYDQARDVVEAEQSLELSFEGLNAAIDVYSPDSGIVLAADTGLAVRKFFRAMNFMGYNKLQAFVYGNLDTDSIASSDSVLYFFRMGYDKDAYYEYRTLVKPGWDAENHVLIDFPEITGLKAKLLNDRKSGIDSSLVRVHENGKYMVKIKPTGNDPTLTRIQYFSMGVVNLDRDKPAKGEIWIDELRLTDVKNDVGMAARFSVNGNISDLFNYTFGYSTQDAYYRGVSSATKGGAANNLGSGETNKNYNFSGSMRLEKFFPRSLEMQMPVSFNWSQTVNEPLLRSGTDITVPDELKDIETSVSVTRGFRISEQFNKKTRNLLYVILLNRLSSSFSYNVTKGHSATQPMYFRERYDAKASFDLSARKPPSVKPLFWMKWIKVPFGLPETRLYLYPDRLNFSGTLGGSYSESVNQNSANPTTSKLDFRGGMNSNFKVLENLTGSYSVSTTRDLRDPETVNLSLNNFRLGVEQNYSQNFRANYSPSIFRFLTHKFDYSASYGDTYRTGRDSTGIHSVTSKVNANASFQFDHTQLIGSNNSRPGGRGRGRGRGGGAPQAQPQEDSSSTSILDYVGLPLRGIRYITDAIRPISGKIGTGQSMSFPGLAEKASMPFRFGLTDDPGVESVNTTTTTVRESKSITRSFSASSGVSLFAGISVDVSYGRNTRETFDATPTKNISEKWPDLRFNLRQIRGLWYVGKVLNSLSPNSGYSRSKNTKQRTTSPYPSQIDEQSAFAPLISFTINPLRSMRSTVRYETSSSTNTQISETSGQKTNITKRSSQSFSFSWSYSFRNPTGVKLPVLGRIKFESNLSLSLDVTYRKSYGEAADAKSNFSFEPTEDKTSLNIRPNANYSFSSTVKGGIQGRWQDSNDIRSSRKSHTRELGIWVELRF